MSEGDLQSAVIDYAHAGPAPYLVAHFRPAQTGRVDRAGKRVWTTPVEADGAGFPDLMIVGNGRAIVAELKRQDGRASAAQQKWLAAWAGVTAAPETHLWRPSDLDEIFDVLGEPHRRGGPRRL